MTERPVWEEVQARVVYPNDRPVTKAFGGDRRHWLWMIDGRVLAGVLSRLGGR